MEHPFHYRLVVSVLIASFVVYIFSGGCGLPDHPLQDHTQSLQTQNTIEGLLEVDIAEDFRGNHWYAYHLIDAKTRKVYRLQTSTSTQSTIPLRELKTGAWVRINAQQTSTPSTLRVDRLNVQMRAAQVSTLLSQPHKLFDLAKQMNVPFQNLQALPTLSLQNITPIFNANAVIKRTVAYIITNLSDKQAYTTDKKKIESVSITKNNDVYFKGTYNLIQFNADLNGDKAPDIFGPFTLTDDSTVNCKSNYRRWQTEATALAKAKGIDLTKYNHNVFIIPNLGSCKFAGIANIGSLTAKGPYRTSIRQEGNAPRVIAHELGHNIGLHHAAVDPNNDGKHNTQSNSEEYGDHSCLMGIKLRNFNAPHLIQLGAFDRYQARVIKAKTGTNKYKLYPLYGDPATTTGAMVITYPNLTLSRMYVLSFKTAKYYDSGIAAKYKTGVSIHTHSYYFTGRTLHVKTLQDGESFKDGDGFEIKQIKKDPNNAFVEIEITTPKPSTKCKPAAPVFTAQVNPVKVGLNTSASLRFTIENKDNVDCGNALFYVTPTLPGGYTVTNARYKNQLITVAPGAKSSVYLPIKHDQTTRTVNVTLSDGLYGTHKDITVPVKVEVNKTTPTIPFPLTGTLKTATSAELKWGTSTDPAGKLAGYKVYRDLDNAGNYRAVAYKSKGLTTHTDSNIPAGTKEIRYYVTARNTVNNESKPSNTILLRVGSKTAPSAPLTLKVTLLNKQDAQLSWSPPADLSAGLQHYHIYAKQGTAAFKKVGTTDKVTWTQKAIPFGKTQYYVTAVDINNKESKPSNTETVERKEATPPTTPGQLTATLTNNDQDALLKWKASTDKDSGVKHYTILKQEGNKGAFQSLGTTNKTTFTDKGILYGVSTYKVTATDNAGNDSKESNTASVNRTKPTPEITQEPSTETITSSDAGSNESTSEPPVEPSTESVLTDGGNTTESVSKDGGNTTEPTIPEQSTQTDTPATPDQSTQTEKISKEQAPTERTKQPGTDGPSGTPDTTKPPESGACGCQTTYSENAPLPASWLLMLVFFVGFRRKKTNA